MQGASQGIRSARVQAYGLKSKTIDLTEVYKLFEKILPAAGRMAKANIKPRLRMIVLYYLANKLNYLVCGTGNKTELSVGYFTKYGDGGADILPLAGLLKTEVWELARELGVPERVINKPPSAGLWSGQTDEKELGISYSELDGILGALLSGGKPRSSREKTQKVKNLLKCSEHKRQLPEAPPELNNQ